MISFSSNKTEIMSMIFLTSNIVGQMFLGSQEGILTSLCIISGLFCVLVQVSKYKMS